MFGWSIIASACRSASKRAITSRVSMPGLMTFSATCGGPAAPARPGTRNPDVFGVGVHSGAEGFDSDFNVGVVGGHVGSNADGSFDIGADVGVNWGPLPNFGAHVAEDSGGDVGVSGRAELYIPTPAGLVGGEVEGAYLETPEGFEVSGSATGRYFSPAGGYVGAGVHGAYGEDADGYHANVGVHGEVGIVGGPEVRGTIDYNEGREGDVSYQGVSTSAAARAYGLEAGVNGSLHAR